MTRKCKKHDFGRWRKTGGVASELNGQPFIDLTVWKRTCKKCSAVERRQRDNLTGKMTTIDLTDEG